MTKRSLENSVNAKFAEKLSLLKKSALGLQ